LAGAANADNSDFLSASTDALILGPTGIPTPDAAYISDAEKLYLDPNGYDRTTASLQGELLGMELHDAYLGLTSAEIDAATPVVEGNTTIKDIPTLTTIQLIEALISASSAT